MDSSYVGAMDIRSSMPSSARLYVDQIISCPFERTRLSVWKGTDSERKYLVRGNVVRSICMRPSLSTKVSSLPSIPEESCPVFACSVILAKFLPVHCIQIEFLPSLFPLMNHFHRLQVPTSRISLLSTTQEG